MKKIKSLILILAIATGISVFANPAMNYTPINTNVIQSHQNLYFDKSFGLGSKT